MQGHVQFFLRGRGSRALFDFSDQKCAGCPEGIRQGHFLVKSGGLKALDPDLVHDQSLGRSGNLVYRGPRAEV